MSDVEANNGPTRDVNEAPPRDDANQRWVIAVVLGTLLGVMTAQTAWQRWRGREVEVVRAPERQYDFKIDLNRANAMELLHLPGIGPKLANAIIAERERNGPYSAVEDLERVKGIGPRLIERIAPYVEAPRRDDPQRRGA